MIADKNGPTEMKKKVSAITKGQASTTPNNTLHTAVLNQQKN